MKKYEADMTCLNMLRIIILAATVVLIAVSAYFLAPFPVILIIVCSVFFVAGFFTSLIYFPMYFKRLKYFVSDEKIIKISGFYFIKKQSVRINKIQFISEISTPFSKLTGLNFVFLYAYGGMLPVMFLSDHDFAEITYNLKV